MSQLSVDYILSLGACWSRAELEKAAEQWPSENPSWEWFLGQRLGQDRAAVLLRVGVALAHCQKQRLNPGLRYGTIMGFFRSCEAEQLTAARAAFGQWLDAVEHGPAAPELSTLRRALGVGIIEAAPVPAVREADQLRASMAFAPQPDPKPEEPQP